MATIEAEAVARSEIHGLMVERPMRVPEVELVGRMPDSAFDEDHWLICYGGSHYIQATKLLYHVLLHCDGETPLEEIARRVSIDTEKELSTDQIRWLVENRLASSGLLLMPASAELEPAAPDPNRATARAGNGHRTAPVPAATPAADRQESVTKPLALRLGIRSRVPLLPYKLTAPITGVLQHLYWPPLMVAAIILSLGINMWLYRSADVLGSVQTVLFTPELALLLFAIDFAMRLFHEFGHAAALKRAGVSYGTIGFAFLIIWPVFYTDVTHAYRLNRAQRIRVDLGGMYFQLYVIIGLYIAYLLTNNPALLLSILFTGLSILEQFTPLIRFDGYYAAADIIGVPEPMSLIIPYVLDHLPWRRQAPKRLPPMRLFARFAFGAYLLLMVAFIIYPIFIVPIAGSAVFGAIVASGKFYWQQFVIAWLNHDVVPQIYSTLRLAMWLLMPLGLGLIVVRLIQGLVKLARSLTRAALRRWSGRRVWATWSMLGALLLSAASMVAPNAYAWTSLIVERQVASRFATVPPVIQPIVLSSSLAQPPADSGQEMASAPPPDAGRNMGQGILAPVPDAGVSRVIPMPVAVKPPPPVRMAQSAPPSSDADLMHDHELAVRSREVSRPMDVLPVPKPPVAASAMPALVDPPAPSPPSPPPAPTLAPSTSLLKQQPASQVPLPSTPPGSNPPPSATLSPLLGSAQASSPTALYSENHDSSRAALEQAAAFIASPAGRGAGARDR